MWFPRLLLASSTFLLLAWGARSADAEEERPWGPPPPESSETEDVQDTTEPEAGETETVPEDPTPVLEPVNISVEPQPIQTPEEPPPSTDNSTDATTNEPTPETSETTDTGSSDAQTTSGEEAEEGGETESDGRLDLRWGRLVLNPFVVLVGGMQYHYLADAEQDRFVTVAMSRFGLEGSVGEHVSLRSSFEVNAGPHGTSVWEGQAAISILDQVMRLRFGRFSVDAGRIIDEASLDYASTHVANLLLTDQWIRTPYLYSGANRGNGVKARVELVQGLNLGFTVNAGNPLSFTGTSMFGGTFGILPRFYFEPQRSVSEDARTFPDDQYYVVLVSPSLTYEWTHLRAQFAYQYMSVDVTRNTDDNPLARGHNFRGGLQGLFWSGRIRPFVNLSYLTNHTFDTGPNNQPIIDQLSRELFEGYTVGMGLDVDFVGNTGIGVQYNLVREQRGDPEAEAGGPIVYNHFLNIGASWWFMPYVCLEARYAFTSKCENSGDGSDCGDSQEHNVFLTLRGVFGLGETERRAQSL